MKASNQIQALKAEYRAQGYTVRQDVTFQDLFPNRAETLKLDLVAEVDRESKWAMENIATKYLPETIIVEIANRPHEGARYTSSDEFEENAVQRFDAISAAVNEAQNSTIEFQIRFLDRSVEQSEARTLPARMVRREDEVRAAIDETAYFLKHEGSKEAPHAYELCLARLWVRWLRMFAYRYPATKGVLKQADLRTIQSDLYAKQVLLTHPRNYRPTHRSLMAIMEGGDVDWSRVRQLKPELERLVAQARKDMLPKERVKKSPNRPEPEGS